jgi:hypothetical protein
MRLEKMFRSRDGTVRIATGYGLDGRGIGFRVLVWAGFFSSPIRPDRYWDPPNFLYDGYRCKAAGT